MPYAQAYGEGYEDMRRRVPDNTLAGELIGFTPRTGIDAIIRNVADAMVADARMAPTRSRLADGLRREAGSPVAMTSPVSASGRNREHQAPTRPSRRRVRRLGMWLIALCAAGGMAMMLVGDRQARPVTIGAVTYWDLQASLESVDLHRGSLDEVTPWWYGLNADGSVSPALASETIDDAVVRLRASGVRLVPTVANTTAGAWAPDVVRSMIHDPTRRQAHVAELVALAVDP